MEKVIDSLSALEKRASALGISFPTARNIRVLGTPVRIGQKTAPNRLADQAMEGCDGTYAGEPGELTMRRYRRLAAGGAGIIWFEATAVQKQARANPRQLYITKRNLDAFKRAAETIRETARKATGTAPLLILQLTHSGRYSKPEGKPAPIIAYHNPLYETNSPLPDETVVTDEELDRIQTALADAAGLAEAAGFDGADIKSCHGYLLSELLSAYTRPGRYGGSFENRTRMLRESILAAMENTSSDFIVTSRLNAYDGLPYPRGFGVSPEGGTDFDPTEPVRLVRLLAKCGIKLLNITMGNPYVNPHVNRPFAAGPYSAPEDPLFGVHRMLSGTAILKHAAPELRLIASAMSYLGPTAPNVAAGYIEKGDFDLAGFGRTVFAYPDYAKDILSGKGIDRNKSCLCCSKCSEIMRAGGTPGCVIRDSGLYLPIWQDTCGRKEK